MRPSGALPGLRASRAIAPVAATRGPGASGTAQTVAAVAAAQTFVAVQTVAAVQTVVAVAAAAAAATVAAAQTVVAVADRR